MNSLRSVGTNKAEEKSAGCTQIKNRANSLTTSVNIVSFRDHLQPNFKNLTSLFSPAQCNFRITSFSSQSVFTVG